MGFVNSDIDATGQVKPDAPLAQLYNLKDDLSQQHNVIAGAPGHRRRMQARLDELKLKRGKPAKRAPAVGVRAGPNATVLKDGKPYRAIGVNYFNCFLRTLKSGDDTSYDAGFADARG